MANNFNIEIFHKNIELLRSLTKLKKGEFTKLIGIANAYRKDFDALGLKMIKGITENFQGVDDVWLSIPHPEGTKGIIFTPRKISELVLQYKHEGLPGINHLSVMDDVSYILKSKESGIITALISNVREFKRAVDTASELTSCQERLDIMQTQIDELKQQFNRIAAPPIGVDHADAS